MPDNELPDPGQHDPGPADRGGSPQDVLAWLKECRQGGAYIMTSPEAVFRRWRDVLADVSAVTDYLVSSGVTQGMRVGIRGHNSYEWMVLDLALLAIGATPVALPVPEFAGQRNADIAERFLLSVSFAGRGCLEPSEDSAVPLDDLLRMPPITQLVKRSPPEEADGRQAFTLAFSSGTAGRLKCLRVSWEGCARLIEATGPAYALRPSDRILVSLPLSTFQQRYLVYLAIRNDCSVILTTSGRFLPALKQCKPTIMLGPPNFYDFAAARYSGENRKVIRDAAAAVAALIPVSGLSRRLQRLAFQPAHQLYGGAIRLMLVGSAPVHRDMLGFFARAGFPLYQIYGMTETGFLTWNTPAVNRIGSVGKPVYPGTVSIDHDGEVLIRHSWHLCLGYEGEPAAEAANVFRADNVIATGDLGRLDDDGFLYLQGRKKNLIMTSGGQKIQIEDLEAELSSAAGVSRVAVFSTKTGELACVAWFTGQAAATAQSLRERIRLVNIRLASDLRLRQAALVEGPLEADSPFLNRNLKLNREAVAQAMTHRLRPVADIPGTGEQE